jgi:phospholipid N-methyltransferase
VKVNRVSVTVLDNWGNGGNNFTRNIPFDKLTAIMTAAEVDAARKAKRLHETPDKTGFFLSGEPEPVVRKVEADSKPAQLEEARERLAAGVQVVAAPQLFPTPADLAARMVELADIKPGFRVLEPSAGTGQIVKALRDSLGPDADITACEISPHLADTILRGAYRVPTFCGDFLSFNGEMGTFDRIVMNPPFDNGVDIKHIRHAMGKLRPGGRLVALCANGPRQHEQLRPLAATWEELPAGTFDGTGVRAALLVIDKSEK